MANEETLRDYLKWATTNLHDARRRLHEVEERGHEPIAVVGMGCRFPGDVHDPDGLWELLATGTDAIAGLPQDRDWDLDDLPHPDSEQLAARKAGFIYDAGEFDAGFFGISPREALAMDPQQRLLLEVCWEALERSGIDPRSLRGSSTGVFAGAALSGYGWGPGMDPELDGHLLTGTATSIISGRVAYFLGLEGPAVTVDTACSSSLVALHLACQSLRSEECSLAMAGGVTLLTAPFIFTQFSTQLGLASDGRCKAFSASADGMGVAEGVGMIVLERLSEARRNGHQVLAVVRGSAINQDGASNGLTAPNGPSQQRVIRAALANARLSASEVDVVEAHGTGTELGDPIEAQALLATYGQDRSDDRPLWLGSIKSNIGHAQAAAGVAGIIKMVLALRHEELPRTLHADERSPHVDWSAGDVRLLNTPVPWPSGDTPRRAGVSGFGMSGTNVHAILEEAPAPDAAPAEDEEPTPEPTAEPVVPVLADDVPTSAWVVSGRSAEALAGQAERLREFVEARPGLDPAAVAWSLVTMRSVFEHRAVLVGNGRDELTAGLSALAADRPAAGAVNGTATGGSGRVVFVFPGQGSQWIGMGRELAASSPVFAARLAECADALAPFVDWSLQDVLAGTEDAPGLETADVVQPVLWAVMVSLAAVWEAAGVRPDAVVGHSQGEIAAACVAGILSLQDAAKVVALRSKALTVLAGRGGMLSIAEDAGKARGRLAEWGERLSVAAVNGPAATVVSGEPDALDELAAACEAESVRTRLLPVDYASHSAQVEAIEQDILDVLEGIAPSQARTPMVSAMTGEFLDGPELDASYWYASLRATVEFDRAVRVLGEAGHRVFVEASPHPVLTSAITDALDDEATAIGTLRRDDGGADRLLTSLAEAHVSGTDIDWTAVLPASDKVELPTYAFQRRRYWTKPSPAFSGTGADGEAPPSAGEARFWAAVEDGDVAALAAALAVDDRQPLREVLPALASWRKRERDESVLEGWRYRVSWTPVAESGKPVLSGTWLAVVPAGGAAGELADACVRALADRGADVIVTELAAEDLDRRTLADRLRALLTGERADGADATSPAGVLSLLALDEEPVPAHPAVTAGVAGTLTLLQALGDAGIGAPMWALTRGAVAVGPGERLASTVQSQVWGLGRVAGLEHHDRWGGLIDLPAVLDGRSAVRLCRVLAGCGEDQVALRPSGIMARRLVRAVPRRGGDRRWMPRGSVLVTGATGAVGPYLARWAARSGASHVVLPSRRGPGSARAARLAAELAESGSAVSMIACNVAERDQVAALLDRIDATGPALSSVLHAANLVHLMPLDATDLAEMGVALGAKVAGARWLDELTADRDLDAFVLFSSIAATWGGGEHGAYAAANAHLDALALDRRARGLPATSVAWGVWDTREPGELDDELPQIVKWLLRQGMGFLNPVPALAALDQVLADDETFLAVADVDWTKFAPVFSAARPAPLLDEIPEVARLATAEPAAGEVSGEVGELAAELAGATPAERERIVADLVRVHAAAVLGHASADAVEADRAFRDMGFDSLTAVELRNRLNTATGLRLPSTVVFDYPSAVLLAREIVTEVLGTPQETAPIQVSAAAPGEPIAIVGMSCRFPGGVTGPDRLWELLASGGDAISGFPANRGWETEGLFDSDPGRTRTSYASQGGFLHEAVDFDPGFFGISPREALAMDPQQRLLLELSWEAFERAGIAPETLQGSQTGVFAGASPSGYLGHAAGMEGFEGHLITGNAGSVISGRVSYALGLEGPAVTLDTACSSSLVALHLACQALRSGECSLALAGGVMVMASPAGFVGFSRQRVLAADGRCKAFSADADGMGLGEGAGMLLVERLSDARRNGHPVLAVVTGSAINQDGASNGLTAPNGPSQQRVIRSALASAGLSAADVDAVEAHGTGTELGDPIEAQALLATYGQNRPEDRPLWLGSIKSNLGHSQQAAGVAGVMKMVLALQHGELPRTLHVDEPSPHVDWSSGAVRLLAEPVSWVGGGRSRRAGVSAFGISGTNAHIILEEPPALDSADVPEESPTPVLTEAPWAWTVSGRTASGLAAQARRLGEFVSARPGVDPVDVGWSLATTRTAFEHRAVVTGSGREELLTGLGAVAAGESRPEVVSGVVPAGGAGRVGFVFAGQGSQRAGMAAGLYEASPVFAETFDQVCGLLEAELGFSVADVVLGRGEDAEARADWTVFAQAGLFAVQAGLLTVLEACGVRPDAVAGHSVGEVAAAYAAGVVSLPDACRLVAARGRLMQALPEGGAMAAVAVSETDMLNALQGVAGAEIAAVNGPQAVVISGDQDAVDHITDTFREQGVRVRRLRVSHAFHSPRMDPVLDELAQIAAQLTYSPPALPWAGALTGELVTEPGAEYWVGQARRPVRYADAVATLAAQGVRVFIEIGPDGTLSALGPGALDNTQSQGFFIPTQRPGHPADQTLLGALARAHVHGVPIDWIRLLPTGTPTELPTYAFQHQKYWPDGPQGLAAYLPGTQGGGDGASSEAEARFWSAVEGGDARALAETLAVDEQRPFSEVLPALASWRQRERDRSATASWRYRASWVPITEPDPAPLSGAWLFVVPAGVAEGLADECARAVTGRGARIVRAEIPAGEPHRESIAAHLAQVLREDATDDGTGLAGVVSLLAVDESAVPGFPAVSHGLAGTQALVQALGDLDVQAPLWVLTQGAVAAGPDEVLGSPAQTQVWGLGRVAGLEHPDRWGGLIDLPAELDDRAGVRLRTLLAGCGEDQAAIRPAGILARRLTRAPLPRSGGAWLPRGSVLVTGGSGAIGGHVARWLAGRGAPRLVLASRSGAAAPGAAALAAELAGRGSTVEMVSCDIAQRAQAAGLLDRIAADGPPLVGVMHTAGLGQGTALQDTNLAELAAVAEAKTAGAAHLDELTDGLDLDAFVLFSSISATWGSGRQPGYAAANAYLDALAGKRRARGLAATSVAWGPWGGGGMGDGETGVQLQRLGLRPMDPGPAIRALAQAVDADEAPVAVADVDWDRFVPAYTLRRPSPLIAGLPEVRRALAAAADRPAAPEADLELGRRLTGLPRAEQDRLLTELIRAEAATVLGHASMGAVEAERAFRDLGFDSLTAVELRNRMQDVTGLRLPATLVFDYPTPAVLARHLRDELLGDQDGTVVAVTAAADEPIAIVGMGCRYPGGIGGPEDMWELLATGGDAISGFPADRGWDGDGAFGSGAGEDSYVKAGGFLHDAGEFDPGFFGISPREALAMDPQQRLLLEVCWETLERAGIDPRSLRGSRTGMFAGASSSGYDIGLLLAGNGTGGLEGHLATGNAGSVISGRVSYAFGLEGPAVTVDTACSSSLVALHLACQALRSGECSLALAGGVTVMATPGTFMEFSRQQGLAADGRCKSFAGAADGTGWAEGVGVLVVERLSDARRHGHRVLALVAGSAVNQDGASNGLTAPNGPSQQRVIRSALASAGLSASDVDAVEAHGTGTTLGDPIEAQAVLATYGQDRPEDNPLWLGSVKSNIGHAQQAAGVAGIIKMVLALQHEELPRTLHVDEPSPHVDWSSGAVSLLTSPASWPTNGRPRRAGVSAFGMSGTNAHVIVAEAPEEPSGDDSVSPESEAPKVLDSDASTAWVVSARTPAGVAAQAGRLAGHMATHAELDPADVGWSLVTMRSAFEHRAVVLGGERKELLAGLSDLASGRPAAGVVSGTVPAGGGDRVVFVFPGQGSQWIGMGRELAASSPVFAARLAECADALAPFVDWSLQDVLAGADKAPDLETADVVQPVLWAVMVSLAAVWEAAGVRPDAVLGHSQGEIAAACVAGILSLEDAAKVVALRSKALTVLAGRGGMLSVAEDAAKVRERLAAWGERLSIAAVNGPAATIVSGEPEALDELAAACEAESVRTRLLPVDYASHSAQVEGLRSEIVAALEGVVPSPTRIPMVSAMTGEFLNGLELDASYWYASLRATVEFDRAVRALGEAGHRVFVEVSPHRVLTAAITDTLEDVFAASDVESEPPVVLATLRRDDGGPDRLLVSLADAHVSGRSVDWTKVLPTGRQVDLPTYAFQHQRFWPVPAAAPALLAGADGTGSAAEARFWTAVERGDVSAVAATLAVDDQRRLADLLPALRTWRRRERDESTTVGWRYRITWAPVAEAAQSPLSGTWLAVLPSEPALDALPDACVQALTTRGAHVAVVRVPAATADRALLADQIRLALATADGASTEPQTAAPVEGVVSLLGLDEALVDGRPAVTAGLVATQALVQALGDAEVEAPLWVATQGAVAAGANEVLTSPVQAQVWGLGRVAGLEHPDRWGGLVDLPPVWDERVAARLCGVLAGCGEDQVAVRSSGVLARRLVRAPRPRVRDAWKPGGTVLVTGGTGAVGGHVARWLAGRDARRVVLTSRSGPAAVDMAARAATLASAGVDVEVVAGDISRRTDVAELLAWIGRSGPPLTSVIHAAGAGQGSTLDDTTTAGLAAVLSAKATGAALLDELTSNLDLDAFVLFSSGAATWGSGGQSAYAAANTFLDALAESRRARGLVGSSVAWGLWGGGGMGSGEGGDQLQRLGMRVMNPDLAVRALGQVLDAGEGPVTVADVDWTRFTPVFTLHRPSPLISSLPEVGQVLASAGAVVVDGAESPLVQRLAGLSRADQDRLLVDVVRAEAAAVLGHASADAVEPGRAFKELGFDSLTAVELRNRLRTVSGLSLPSTLVFDYPTARAVAGLLRSELLGDPVSTGSVQVVAAVSDEPIAIVGMSCRYPGGVGGPEEMWDLLATGRDAISGFPQDRGWEVIEELYRSSDGNGYTRQGGFVYDAAGFDAGFFGISPREALAMDPQQRLLLETSWEALERAGIEPGSLRGSATGVYAGAASSGYGVGAVDGAGGSEGYLLTGGLTAVISGRVAYTLGLEGPAVTVDTACSSSLVALHLACQSLRTGECTLALAGGVAVLATPGAFAEFSKQQGLAADGRCKAFGAEADGIGWAEGAGVVVVERLSDAQRNGHQVLAVIRGSAINQDGASNGLTAPNGLSQQRVIRAALANAQMTTADIDAVEAHGTGTTLGDPIEAQALLATYGQGRPGDRPLWLGSVKSNIGHTGAAAGIAGVIKMVLALRHEELPRTLYAEEPSPHVDWSAGRVELLNERLPWTANGHPRRAGVSAFGVSGTNAHIIVEEAPGGIAAPETGPAGTVLGNGVTAWVMSGRTADGLAAQAGRLREFAAARPEPDPADVGWSLVTTRSVFEHRAVVMGTDRRELAAGLAAVATGRPAGGTVTGIVPSGDDDGRVVFVFPGQGSQWTGMGRELATSSPVFAARLAECAAALAPYADWSLHDVLAGADGAPGLETADVVQPALWAVMVSLAAVWEAAGVRPDAVVGHSQGEIAAACVAGILSLEDAAKVVALRSKALTVLAGRGGMLSIAESASRVRERLAEFGERLSVAAVNGPEATVVSGEPSALDELAAACASDGVRTRLLPVDYASHSAQVEAIEQEVLAELAGIAPTPSRVPMVSAMTGEFVDGPELDAAYWYGSLRAPVEFDRAVRVLGEAGHRAFVEVSPHPVLTSAITDTLEAAAGEDAPGAPATAIGTLRRDDGGADRFLASLAEAHVSGTTVDWTAVIPAGRRVDLPTYAFRHQRYWLEVSQDLLPGRSRAFRKDGEPDGTDDAGTAAWRYRISWSPVTGTAPAVLSGTWLVVTAAGAAEDGVVQALTNRGVSVLLVEADPATTDRAALTRQITQVLASDDQPGPSVAGVVSLLALDESIMPGASAVTGGLAGTLALVLALGDADVVAPLWVITRGAVGTGPDEAPASPAQAQAWGLGRVAGLEHPDRWGGLIDLPPVWDERAAAGMCAALAGCGEDQVAVRPSGITARRLVRAVPGEGRGEPWTPRGTVLVTGAGGSVGPHLTRWLGRLGAPHVVLATRSGPDVPGAARLAAQLAEAGTRVSSVACDIAERDQVAGLLAWADAVGPALTSVFHAAVAVDLLPLQETGPDELAHGLGAKAAGARWLDELTAGRDLDAFVLFSSIAATWGVSDHGVYAAANAHLDALALDRRARGLPATSVAWGVWGGGDRSDLDVEVPRSVAPTRLLRQGVRFLDPDRALTVLAQALADDEAFLIVADVDWPRFAPVFTAARAWPLLDRIPEVVQLTADAPEETASGAGELAARLTGASPAEREHTVVDLVRAHVAAVLGHGSADAVEPGRAFRDMGFDSLTAVELRNRLNTATGLRLPSTVVFDHPSTLALAREVVARLLGTSEAAAPVPVQAAATGEPIAIVGMGCRYPGGVTGPDQLWDLLATGRDAISGFPADRGWDLAGLDGAAQDGTSHVRQGGFVTGASEFDPAFFGISPREALAMDPQQRLLLEVCWEALERAGIDPRSLKGSPTGVFAGAAPSGYVGNIAGFENSQGHLLTGNVPSVISGRVSYTLGLEGPAVTLDTACSSSLVALHLACQALRSGECSLALAGGVMIMSAPEEFAGFSQQGALAADGRCKAFSASADGMGLAEGAGMLLVERLSDARRLGHPVLAVIRGSAVNQDGASNGLTAPNGPSQQRVIRAALSSAGLSAADVDVVEAHGTGTSLGDPIEAQALLATYGQERPEDRPLWLGSVKSNLGHTQQAAGIAGVMKVALALQHNELPRTLHADEPSPHVDWSTGHIRLLTEPMPWHANGHPRRAGVSAFGISGTNAHIILEEPPAPDPADVPEESPIPVLTEAPLAWLVSGRTSAGLRAQARRLAEFVSARPGVAPVDVGWSLATTRTAFEHRAMVTGSGREELLTGLGAVAAGESRPEVVSGVVPAGGAGRVGFVFAGQGSQRAGMAAGLYEASPVFAETFDQVCGLLEAELGFSVADVVLGRGEDAEARADWTVFAQAGLFAVQAGLLTVLEACGVRPDAVAGHSVGEVAAAYAAGVVSLPDACRLVAARGRLMQALPEGGAMAAVAVSETDMLNALQGVAGAEIAAVNGPQAVVISGDQDAVDHITDTFREQGVRVRRLRVSHAFHSPRMDPVLDELAQIAAQLTYSPPALPWAGALTGELVTEPGPEYWVGQARRPVRYADAVATLAAQGVRVFIEIGPDGTLSALGPAALNDDQQSVFIPTQRPGHPADHTLMTALARAHTHGIPIDWARLLPTGTPTELPTYAFQHQKYWPKQSAALHLGDGTGSSGAEARFWSAVEGGDMRALAETLAVDEQRPFSEVLPVLASWRQRERADAVTNAWRYRVSWTPVPDPDAAELDGTWLLVAPADGMADGLTRQVEQALVAGGADVIVTRPGHAAPDRDDLADKLRRSFAGVVSLLALDEAPLAGHSAVARGVAGTQVLVQALGDAGAEAPLWVVTQGAVAAGPNEMLASPVQAQVWGLGRVAGLEHPDRWGGLIDLPADLDEQAEARLCMLLAGCGEDQAAVRRGGIMGRRLVRAPRPQAGTWKPRGSALVTGGTGAIGARVAHWLAGRGAPRVVLASRSGPDAADAAEIAAGLATAGSDVEVLAADITERAAVTGTLARIAQNGPPLTTVLHTAGLGQATALQETTVEELAAVAEAKTAGATHLDELTNGLDLDAFVLFSSVSATWGSALQPGYAAANAYLDGLAESRRSRGLPASSVAWGLWGGGGMGSGEGAGQLQRLGVKVMDPDLAIRALAQVLDGDEGLVTVADVDWSRFAPVFTLRRPSPLISTLPEAAEMLSAADGPAGEADEDAAAALRQRLSGMPRGEQDRMLTDLVRAQAAIALGYASAEAVEADRAFRDLGFDSLTAVELRNQLSAVTGRNLPATVVFDYPAPAVLAGFLRAELLPDQAAGPPSVFADLDRLEAALAGLGPDGDLRDDVTRRLRGVLSNWLETQGEARSEDSDVELQSATPDEVFGFLDRELGAP
ncbi:type I polyketide synthase [Actinomadura violacea]|uniref:SDR family NAD(P)-dependent oxidoreductase n=1 Tax=Actinomadura violacea TaxID=2819934 RepID=A0ABS3RJM8_9ACTN|nr:type I polyketide synthase [Actinomadura violacea]MBO2456942.1 SDR family NAD(P)-dependent oxidoreductase [Actinomadura violacea]